MFLLPHVTCSQIWLSTLVEDRQPTESTNLKTKYRPPDILFNRNGHHARLWKVGESERLYGHVLAKGGLWEESENLRELQANWREKERDKEARSERASGAIPVFCPYTLALGTMASSAALCIAILLVLAMVNLMPKSLVEGRFLDAGISMVTDQVLPQQQQQQTYSSLLPAERFAEVLGNSPSVVSFVAFASKYVFSALLSCAN